MASIDRINALAEEIRKKKKDKNYQIETSRMNIEDLARDINSGKGKSALTDYLRNNDDIAPLKSTKKEKDDEKNFLQKIFKGSEAFDDNKNLFKDGYDFGDISRTVGELAKDTAITVGSTAGDIALNIIKAPITIGTSLGKGIGAVGAQIAEWSGNEEYAQKVRNRVAGTEKNAFGSYGNPMQNIVNKGIENLDATSVSGDTLDGVAEAVGYQLTFQGAGNLLGAAGNINIGSLKVPTLAVAAGFGEGMGEAYTKEDVEGWQAWLKGTGSGIVSGVTEGLFGMFGVGGSSLDDFLVKSATKKVESALAKAAIKTGIKAGGEATEELLEYTGNYVLDHGIDLLTQVTGSNDVKFGQVWNNEEVLEQMFTAAMSTLITSGGGTALSVRNNTNEAIQAQEQALGRTLTDAEKASIKKSVANDTVSREINEGYSDNELTIIEAEFKNRLEELEKDGNKLSNKQKEEIREQIKEDLHKGYISTDLIESTFAENEYNEYKSTQNKVDRFESEINELEELIKGEVDNKTHNDAVMRINALQEELKKFDTNTPKGKLDTKISEIIKSDGFLQNSYAEKYKKGEVYKVTETSDNENIKSWDKSFVDAKSNNTSKAHDFNEFGAKIIQDKNIKMRAVNYDTLVKEGKMRKTTKDGKAVYEMKINGKYKEVSVNGFKENGVLNVNLQSNRALETVVGHELGEFIKDSDPKMYEELSKIAIELGKADGTYNEAILKSIENTYGDKTDNATDEYVNDKLGELFNNDNFIEQLSTKPNILKKIIGEIKHLVKMATAGSKEQRQLLSLQHKLENKFKEAYRKSDLTKAENTDAEFSLTDDLTTIEQLEDRKRSLEKQIEKLQQEGNTDWRVLENEVMAIEDKIDKLNNESDIKYSLSEDGKELTLYHGTSNNAAMRISKYGLVPASALGADTNNSYNYFTNSYDNANTYKVRKDRYTGRMLRVKKTPDMNIDDRILGHKKGEYDFRTPRTVSPDEIQIQTDDGRWTPITNYDLYTDTPLEERVIDKSLVYDDDYNNVKYSLSEKTQRAINTMGTTENMKVAGYLTSDGQFIDFSGKYQGARGDQRQMDHREIADIYTDEEYDAAENKYSNMGTATAIMQDFIDDGNIRTTGTGVDISIEPTKAQYDKLYSYLEYVQRDNGEVFIDLESETKNRENLEYNEKTSISKMINDIKNHYSKYSLSNQDDIASRKSNLTYSEDVKIEEAIAPLQETVDNLSNQITELSNKITNQLIGKPVTEADLPMIEQQDREAFNTLDDSDMPFEETTLSMEEDYEFLDADAKGLLRELSNGSVRKVNALYNEIANSESVEQTRKILEQYKNIYDENYTLQDIKKLIRNTKLNTTYVKGQITDYNNFRKSNFGKLKLGKDGMSVDSFYQELSELYPMYFDSEISTTADQLERMAEVVNEDTTYLLDTIDNETMDYYARTIHNAIALNEITKQTKKIPLGEAPIEDASNTNEISPIRQAFENKVRESSREVEKELGYIPQDPTRAETYIRNNMEIARQEAAKVLEERPTQKNKEKRLAAVAVINLVDKGYYISKLARETNNRQLDALWDNTLLSGAQAQEVIGEGRYRFNEEAKTYEKVGDSVYEIYEAIENTGKKQQFDEYMYHRLNVERMSLAEKGENNKPVFGDSVTADISRQRVAEIEQNNPEFSDYAKKIYNYESGKYSDLSLLIESGILSVEDANYYRDKYKNYVPIIRDIDANALEHKMFGKKVSVGNVIKKATGGNQDIIPLKDAMAIKTMLVQRSANMNKLGLELMETLNPVVTEEKVTADKIIDDISNSKDLIQAGTNGQAPTMTVYEHGVKKTFEITDEIYQALKANYDSNLNITIKPLNAFSNFKRGVLTQYNPFFMVTNAIKDSQDILINSQHPLATYKAIPEAIAQLSSKGYWYKEMQSQGLFQDTYYDNQQGFNVEKSKIENFYPLRKISEINDFIERVPRMAEYIASRKAGASVEVASLDASRVTTNFKAGGDFTKFLNRNGFTFLNASVQGATQQVRNFQEAHQQGLKGYMKLATKFAVAALPAILLNNLVWEDDEEYEELSDYIKDNYYIIGKYGDGQFIRIPKGRMTAVIQDGLEQMTNLVTGDEEADLNNFLDLVLTNLAPSNPLENNILAPFFNTKLFNKQDPGKTWYGEDLVPLRLQDKPVAEQFDEGTSELAKWLGEKLNLSPIKIDNLIDQNTGVIGDLLLPTMTAEAKTKNDNPIMAAIEDKFTADATFDSKYSSDFYETKDRLTVAANGSNATNEDILKNKYMNSVQAEMNDIYAEIREVQNSDLDKTTKFNQVRELRKLLNEIAKEGLDNYESVNISGNYATVGDRQFKVGTDGEWEKITSKQQEKQEEVISSLNISASEYWSNKDEYDYAYESPSKYAVATAVGGYDIYKQYSSELNDIKADKDTSGKSISGSRKAKVIDYINNLDADYETKIILYKSEYTSDDTYNYEIIDYLNNREDIDFTTMRNILIELGFSVDANGNISW